MKKIISDNGNFVRSAELVECVSPANHYQLKFTSKWRDAKDPEAEQVNFTAMLTKEEIKYFVEFLNTVK
jgi:hypothetical protein